MSKYGTFPASTSTPAPEGSPTALDSTSSSANVPGASPAAARRPWREFADPRALSVPRGLADARHRARANLARFAANYGLVSLAVFSVSLLWRPIFLPMVVPLFFASPGDVLRLVPMFTPFLLLVTRSAAGVLVLLLAGAHAVLHLPADSVDADEEEAGAVLQARNAAGN
ncbi:uncharacterized protein C2845_PM05G26450 [Panicum miliaceum]|uniref:PRA1 family protein n=1 Tax=Panicum miliaceum TaxID=4540 RepID=A0A3L6T1C2_PANMI|nr:uncharacterized protein C2845_PM05G26450 [Panicum miliaceum]